MTTPDDVPVGYHRELLDLLTGLRHRQGGSSLTEISSAASVSKSHLSPIFAGKALPSPQTAVAIARALGGTDVEQTRAGRYAEGAAADRAAIRAGGGTVLGEILDTVRSLTTGQPPPVSWPVRVGVVPALASALRGRTGLREQVAAARTRAGGVVLTQVLAGGGGVGKTQLAASYAVQALTDKVDLVVWVDTTGPDAVPAAYARAAVRVRAPGADGSDADVDAQAFLDWLATTTRSWLVVLDDITEPQQVAPWWPFCSGHNCKINENGSIADPLDGAAPPDSETATPQHIPRTRQSTTSRHGSGGGTASPQREVRPPRRRDVRRHCIRRCP